MKLSKCPCRSLCIFTRKQRTVWENIQSSTNNSTRRPSLCCASAESLTLFIPSLSTFCKRMLRQTIGNFVCKILSLASLYQIATQQLRTMPSFPVTNPFVSSITWRIQKLWKKDGKVGKFPTFLFYASCKRLPAIAWESWRVLFINKSNKFAIEFPYSNHTRLQLRPTRILQCVL